MIKYKRIWILGGSGAGKTTFAKKLSEKIGIKFYPTDYMAYSEDFKIKNSRGKKCKLLKDVSMKRRWIIEGAHDNEWVIKSFGKADLIILLDTKTMTRLYRIMKRDSKLIKEGGKSRFLKSMNYVLMYYLKGRRKHKRMIKTYGKNFVFLKNNKDINKFLESIE